MIFSILMFLVGCDEEERVQGDELCEETIQIWNECTGQDTTVYDWGCGKIESIQNDLYFECIKEMASECDIPSFSDNISSCIQVFGKDTSF